MLKKFIGKLVEGENLTVQETMEAMNHIMDGNATQAQIGSFITALRIKGETIEEITGCAKVMREKAYRITPDAKYFIDTCGTGGDGSNTFNISTACAVTAAAGGVAVAKHGNRSVSSKSGSADVLEALGVNISLGPEQVSQCIEEVGLGFMFAPVFHKSMKYAFPSLKTTVLMVIQLSRLPLKLKYPIAPPYVPLFTVSSSSIISMALTLGAPDRVPAGSTDMSASKGVLSFLILPCTFETMCMTWEYFSTCIILSPNI